MTKIIGISGRKQSGKTTAGNFILSLYLAKLGLVESVELNHTGSIVVSDLMGKKEYGGIFDTTWSELETDYVKKQVFQQLGIACKIYTFADVLKKDICINILGLSQEQCYGTDDDKNSITDIKWQNLPGYKEEWELAKDYDPSGFMTARQVLQFVGTDMFRKFKPNVWVDATLKKINKEQPQIAIITDCRFPNEVESITEHGGYTIRLTRNPFNSDHISESILDEQNYDWNKFNYIIRNDKMSIYEQSVEIKNIIQEILSL